MDVMGGVHGAGAERQVKVFAAAFVVVEMNVLEPGTEGSEQLIGGIGLDEEVGVADVEMEGDLGDFVEDFGELADGVEVAREVFDHEADAGFA